MASQYTIIQVQNEKFNNISIYNIRNIIDKWMFYSDDAKSEYGV